jgi:adenylate cyclase class IV
MGRNVEIKARVGDPDRVRRLAARIAGGEPEVLRQDDTFFVAGRARLKLRRLRGGRGELIAYDRPDGRGPRASIYRVLVTERPDDLGELLGDALGVRGRVRKTRELYLAGQTRIHLDDVDGLGHFLELEVVLRPGQSDEDGMRVARELMARLEVPESALVPVAYVDLLDAATDSPAGTP